MKPDSITSKPALLCASASIIFGVFFFLSFYENSSAAVISTKYRDLTQGTKGLDVIAVQHLLGEHGFASTTPTGIIDAQTVAHIAALQHAFGLQNTSIVDPATRLLLNEIGGASTSPMVAELPPPPPIGIIASSSATSTDITATSTASTSTPMIASSTPATTTPVTSTSTVSLGSRTTTSLLASVDVAMGMIWIILVNTFSH